MEKQYVCHPCLAYLPTTEGEQKQKKLAFFQVEIALIEAAMKIEAQKEMDECSYPDLQRYFVEREQRTRQQLETRLRQLKREQGECLSAKQ